MLTAATMSVREEMTSFYQSMKNPLYTEFSPYIGDSFFMLLPFLLNVSF